MDELKELLQTMYSFFDNVGEQSNISERLEESGLKASAFFTVDILHFLAYLAASDGVISWNETKYICDLLDLNMTPETLNELIIENDLYSEEFEEAIPTTLDMMVKVDNAIYNASSHAEFEAGQAVLTTYMILGKGLVESNGVTVETMDSGMRANLESYLGMMQNYIEENTDKHHTDIICDYDKKRKTDGIPAPKKNTNGNGSVKAPKKKL